MSAPATTTVEIDSALMERLRERDPQKSDRELLEDLVVISVGFAAVRRAQGRLALDEDEAIALGVEAVREARRERRAAA